MTQKTSTWKKQKPKTDGSTLKIIFIVLKVKKFIHINKSKHTIDTYGH